MKKEKETKKSINVVPFLIIIVVVIFLCILLGPDTLNRNADQSVIQSEYPVTIKAAPTVVPTATDLPEDYPNLPREYFDNEKETEGIIIGGIILVLIILLGILISKHNNEKQK